MPSRAVPPSAAASALPPSPAPPAVPWLGPRSHGAAPRGPTVAPRMDHGGGQDGQGAASWITHAFNTCYTFHGPSLILLWPKKNSCLLVVAVFIKESTTYPKIGDVTKDGSSHYDISLLELTLLKLLRALWETKHLVTFLDTGNQKTVQNLTHDKCDELFIDFHHFSQYFCAA